jgi:hypothetical protein
MPYTKYIFLVLISALLFSACKSYKNVITTDLSVDSYGFYYDTPQDSIDFQALLHEFKTDSVAFLKRVKEEKIPRSYWWDYPIQEAQYPGGISMIPKKMLENLNLPKNAKKGITKIRIIFDKEDYRKPEILQYNDKRVKDALIESTNNLAKWRPSGRLINKWYPYRVDLSLVIKSEKNILTK